MHVVHDRQCISKCAKALFRKMLVSIVERNDGHVCCISPLKLLCSQSHWITQPRCTPSSISGQFFLRFLPAWFLPWSNSKQQTSQGLGLVTKGISKAQIFRSWYMPFGSSRAWRLMMPTNTRDAMISFFNFRLGCAPSSQDHVSLSLITSQFFAGNSQGSHPRSWRGLLHRSERSNWETRKSPRSMRQNAERNLRTLQAKQKERYEDRECYTRLQRHWLWYQRKRGDMLQNLIRYSKRGHMNDSCKPCQLPRSDSSSSSITAAPWWCEMKTSRFQDVCLFLDQFPSP